MGMDKNTLTIASIISEHHLANGDESVGVPIKSFEQRGLGHHDVRIALSILTKEGTVKNYHRCWGHTSIEKGIARYEEVAVEKPKNEDVESYEAYHIFISPKKLVELVGSVAQKSQGKRYITKEGREFYYKSKPIEFKDKQTLYYRIFEILYGHDGNSDFHSYDEIEKALVEQGVKALSDKKESQKRINNAIDTLFRFTHGTLPKTINQINTIVPIRGRGVEFSNPEIKN